jgi:predicted membrane protein
MDSQNNKPAGGPQNKKYAVGIVFILIGALLIAFNTGALPYDLKHIIISWPMLLITIGVISLLKRESVFPGAILITIGGFFLLPRIFHFDYSEYHLFWPMILIVVGLFVLFKGFHRPVIRRKREHPIEGGYIIEDNVFSGTKKRVIHQEFKGGQINCIFGGSEIDLTQTVLAEGTNELEINAIFGGITLVIPSDWKVIIKTTSIFGGFTDKRWHVKEPSDSLRILVVKGSTIFGGGEIKSI